jgi:hypothetical protein
VRWASPNHYSDVHLRRHRHDCRHQRNFNSPREILRTRKGRCSLGRAHLPLFCALLPASARSPRCGHRPLLHLPDRQRSRTHTSSSACHPRTEGAAADAEPQRHRWRPGACGTAFQSYESADDTRECVGAAAAL